MGVPYTPDATKVFGADTESGELVPTVKVTFGAAGAGVRVSSANPLPVTVSSGTVTVANASIPVTGTFWQATQPVSLTALPALAAGGNVIGSISNASFGISGTLPAFAATPTFNIGTTPSFTFSIGASYIL